MRSNDFQTAVSQLNPTRLDCDELELSSVGNACSGRSDREQGLALEETYGHAENGLLTL